jgi:DNA-binding MarR family transcriptional regulator
MQHLPLHESSEELGLRAWVQLVRAYTRMAQQLTQSLEPLGLTLAQYEVLATLWQTPGLTQKELGEWMLVSKGNVCGLMDRMQRNGWLERRGDERDGRVNRLYLTVEGERLAEKAVPHHNRRVSQFWEGFSANELRQLRNLLERPLGFG